MFNWIYPKYDHVNMQSVLKIEIFYILFFPCTKSSKFGVYFTIRSRLNADQLHLKAPKASGYCTSWWLLYWKPQQQIIHREFFISRKTAFVSRKTAFVSRKIGFRFFFLLVKSDYG